MRRALAAGVAVAAVALLGIFAASRPSSRGQVSADVVDFLASDPSGFARVTGPRRLVFPADHGPHPEFQTEWWYYTGNLATAAGDRYGFQLTFFRRGMVPPKGAPAAGGPRSSAWRTDRVFMAHLAITDVGAGKFRSSQRLARGAVGLAGAQAEPFAVWVEDWTARHGADGIRLRGAATHRDGPVALDLRLVPLKPPALHGDGGYSRKGPEPGNASMYYSYSRLEAEGTVRTPDGVAQVSGLAWMDHEWSTSALPRDRAGWDWFSLQLDDGRDLMLFRLRRVDGSPADESGGSIIDADGTTHNLAAQDFHLEVTSEWTSPRSSGRYPSGWRLAVEGAGLGLEVRPLVADQEHDLGIRYWEGAVETTGTASGAPIKGFGYVELTGYAGGASPGDPE